MVLTKSGLGAAFLGGMLALLHLAPGYVTARLVAGDGLSVPWPDTTTEMILLSRGLLYAVGFVVGIGGVFLLGYWAGGQIELQQHYQQYLLTVGFGGLIGYVTLILLFVVYAIFVGAGPLPTQQLGGTVVMFAGRAVGVTLQFAVAGLAGAAFAKFSADTRRSNPASSRSIE